MALGVVAKGSFMMKSRRMRIQRRGFENWI